MIITNNSYIVHPPSIGIPANGLIHYYPFNGNANDEVGSINGTPSGAVLTTDRHSVADKAYYFDGINDKIGFNGIPDLATTDFTVMGWVRRDETGSGAIIDLRDAWEDGFYVFIDGTQNDIRAMINATTIHSVSTVDANWNFFAVVADRDGNMSMYYNGAWDGTPVDISSSGNIAVTNNMAMGSQNYIPGVFFEGAMDGIAIYNRLFSESELDAIFALG